MITAASFLQQVLQWGGRCLLRCGGWMLRGAAAVKRWIERHGGPGGGT